MPDEGAAVTISGSWTAEVHSEATAIRCELTMWEVARGCYLAATLDPDTRNALPGQLPLDAQSWSVLATSDALALHPQVLQCAETFHRTLHDGFSGFDFNDDRDGVWLEGTAQMYAERLRFIFSDGFESGDRSAWSLSVP